MNESPDASDDGIGAILFYGGRLYRLGYARGLAANRDASLDSGDVFQLALEMTLVAKFYASAHLENIPPGFESLRREIEKDIERIDEVERRLAERVIPYE